MLAMMMLVLCSDVFAQRPLHEGNERQIEEMKAKLSLSEKQYSRLKEANQMWIKEQERVRADTSLTREKLMKERKAITEEWNNSVRDILSKEQYENWMAMKPGDARRSRGSVRNVDDLENLKSEVGLSEEQVAEIREINAIMTTGFMKLRIDTTATSADRRAAAKEIVKVRNENIKEMLTPEQYQKFVAYEKARAQTRERRPTRR